MKILVFGSNGQLGSAIKKNSIDSNHYFIFSSRKECNIDNFSQTQKFILNCNPDLIINCSAYTRVDDAEKEQEIANYTNNKAVGNVADICKKNHIILFHISTDYVFDNSPKDYKNKPFTEEMIPNPLSVYGRTKLDGENAVINSGCRFVILRTSWVFSEFGKNFLKTMIKLGSEMKDLTVVDDQFGCPTYAPDIADAIISILESITNIKKQFTEGIFHFTGSDQTSWYLFAKAIFNEAKIQNFNYPNNLIPIKTANYPTQAPRPLYSVLSSDKIKVYYNIDSPSWEDGVKKALHNLRNP